MPKFELYKIYPPDKYIFYPLYKLLRKKKQLSQEVSIIITSIASGVLHGLLALLLMPKNTNGIIIFTLVFPLIGLMKVITKRIKNGR